MKLLLDCMCGALAAPLRMCGHDTLYALDEGIEADERLRRRSNETGRTLVTRDRKLAERTPKSIFLSSRDPDDQLAELHAAGVSLSLDAEPTWCGQCNGRLRTVNTTEAVPTYVPDGVTQVWNCTACGQYFWKGSHWSDVGDRIERAISSCGSVDTGARDEPDHHTS